MYTFANNKSKKIISDVDYFKYINGFIIYTSNHKKHENWQELDTTYTATYTEKAELRSYNTITGRKEKISNISIMFSPFNIMSNKIYYTDENRKQIIEYSLLTKETKAYYSLGDEQIKLSYKNTLVSWFNKKNVLVIQCEPNNYTYIYDGKKIDEKEAQYEYVITLKDGTQKIIFE